MGMVADMDRFAKPVCDVTTIPTKLTE